jgi:hypothetical protein
MSVPILQSVGKQPNKLLFAHSDHYYRCLGDGIRSL